MSCLLLQDPERLHDIVDDLESVYWAFVWAVMDHFALPNQLLSKADFEEAKLDSHGRTIGGNNKQSAILTSVYPGLRLSSKPLENLLRLCNSSWHKYHFAICCPEDDEEYGQEAQQMQSDATLPSFWLSHFTSILEDQPLWDHTTMPTAEEEATNTDAEGPARTSHDGLRSAVNTSSDMIQVEETSSSGKKRKLADTNGADDAIVLRRSKRLKMRQC